jgi:ATP-dependent Clp protease ATP-binding subunit ClpA
MFERFHQDARHAVVRARHEAVRARQDRIGCEHLLLGLLAEPGVAAEALTAAGLEITGLRALLPGDPSGTDPGPLDAEALASLGIDLDAVRRATDAAFGRGALDRVSAPRRDRLRITGGLRMTADAKKSMELALRAATGLHHGYISSGHVLIGILNTEDNAVLAALRAAGIDTAALRADVVRRMTAAA